MALPFYVQVNGSRGPRWRRVVWVEDVPAEEIPQDLYPQVARICLRGGQIIRPEAVVQHRFLGDPPSSGMR